MQSVLKTGYDLESSLLARELVVSGLDKFGESQIGRLALIRLRGQWRRA
jgi:hypothetical protein